MRCKQTEKLNDDNEKELINLFFTVTNAVVCKSMNKLFFSKKVVNLLFLRQ